MFGYGLIKVGGWCYVGGWSYFVGFWFCGLWDDNVNGIDCCWLVGMVWVLIFYND